MPNTSFSKLSKKEKVMRVEFSDICKTITKNLQNYTNNFLKSSYGNPHKLGQVYTINGCTPIAARAILDMTYKNADGVMFEMISTIDTIIGLISESTTKTGIVFVRNRIVCLEASEKLLPDISSLNEINELIYTTAGHGQIIVSAILGIIGDFDELKSRDQIQSVNYGVAWAYALAYNQPTLYNNLPLSDDEKVDAVSKLSKIVRKMKSTKPLYLLVKKLDK